MLKTKFREWGSVAMFIMVTALFVLWGLFGAVAVQRQNSDILKGVQAQLDEAVAKGAENGRLLAQAVIRTDKSTRAITCILLIEPEDRTQRATAQCLKKFGI